MAKPEQPQKLEFLAIDDVAALLLVTDRTIRNWLETKDMPSIKDGRGRRFLWSDVLPWYVKTMAEADGNRRKPASDPYEDLEVSPKERLDAANLRRTVAEADLRELDLAERRGHVVAVEDVSRTLQDVAKNLQIEILAWPTLMVSQIFGMRDRNQLMGLLTSSARDLCTRLAGVGMSAASETPTDG